MDTKHILESIMEDKPNLVKSSIEETMAEKVKLYLNNFKQALARNMFVGEENAFGPSAGKTPGKTGNNRTTEDKEADDENVIDPKPTKKVKR